MCGEPSLTNLGNKIKLAGWVSKRRDHGQLIFIDLRDKSGITQVVFNPTISKETYKKAKSLRSEWVISVEGDVLRRIEGAENEGLGTGSIELVAEKIEILSKSLTPPFEIDDTNSISEEIRLKYRFLDLRRNHMQSNLQIRHDVTNKIWNYLTEKGFVHIETPILIKSTPEGARDYVVPSRIKNGSFYALPQSPQQMKQILMVSGCDKYFQIARCFRDEDLRADRQPEHTQLDLEMSFVHQQDVMSIVEQLYLDVIKEIKSEVKINKPFEILTYDESMDKYGTDKPDLRFDMPLFDLSKIAQNIESNVIQNSLKKGGILKGLLVKDWSNLGRKDFDRLTDLVKSQGAGGLIYISISKEANINTLKLEDTNGPLNKFFTLDNIRDMIKFHLDKAPVFVPLRRRVPYETRGSLP